MGCRNQDRTGRNAGPDNFYLDYTVSADEGDENVTCTFQFRKGGPEGQAVEIAPAKVELDGQVIDGDSARLSGFYYEVQKAVDSFAGKHTVVLVAPGTASYTNNFEFSPFTLAEELPAVVHRRPLSVTLLHFPPHEKAVRLLLLDTAFVSTGFNDLVPVVNGKLTIGPGIWNHLKNGPVNLELYLEQEIPLSQPTRAGGAISITYGLKRTFELAD